MIKQIIYEACLQSRGSYLISNNSESDHSCKSAGLSFSIIWIHCSCEVRSVKRFFVKEVFQLLEFMGSASYWMNYWVKEKTGQAKTGLQKSPHKCAWAKYSDRCNCITSERKTTKWMANCLIYFRMWSAPLSKQLSQTHKLSTSWVPKTSTDRHKKKCMCRGRKFLDR